MSGSSWTALKALDSDPAFTLVAACDTDATTFGTLPSGEIARFTDFTAMLDSALAEAVIIALPNDLHPEAALAALGHGVHICCEKPLTITSADAAAMDAAAHASGATL